jgi:hypothetical protein
MAFLYYYGAILAMTMIFSWTEKEEQQDSDTFNFGYTAIIASCSWAEIVGLTLVILTVDTKGRIAATSCAERVSFSCVCLLRWKAMPQALAIVDLFLFGTTLCDGREPLA